jgi:hypothetical protein
MNMTLFLKLTSFCETLTGIALIVAPKCIVWLLFQSVLNDTGGILIALIAGAALLSIGIMSWLVKDTLAAAPLMVKALLFYNISVTVIVLYGMIRYDLRNPGVWLVTAFHLALAIGVQYY